ncbi:YgjP-like metallopeptidase domain-containing protein [Streptomyces sp. NPDC015032]|uniref:YgjP-like metallopeptidase domain-containing protein n=1 Tax=Streptomyces sp. NPDC015032 TaxID=3364937 RepID=UPI0036F9C813
MSTPVHQAIAALPVPGEWTWQVVVRPRRRTLGIEVADGGDILFAVPPDADPAAVAQAVRTRLPRLAREVRRRRTRPDEPVKELVGGTGFAYLGRRHRLKLLSSAEAGRVRLHRGWLELPRSRTVDEGARQIAQWYEACGTRWLSGRLPSYASRFATTVRRETAAAG